MLKGSISWATSGIPTFLKGSGAEVSGPEMLAAFLDFAADEAIPEGAATGVHRLAAAMVAYARPNAPWNDVTGAARQGLHAEVIAEDRNYMAALVHGVDYGIWLEVRWNGRYAIILPTQEIFASKAAGIVAGEIALALEGRGSKFRSAETGRFV